MIDERDVVKLHTTPAGQLWWCDGELLPQISPRDIIANILRREKPVVRLLGIRENAYMIVKLHGLLPESGGHVEVASPRVCDTKEEVRSPVISLHRMRQCMLPASLGGWHTVTAADIATYRLLASLYDGVPAGELVEDFKCHPVYRYLSFIDTLDISAAVKVVGRIVDPRWHVSLQHPESLAGLRMRMGVSPRCLQRLDADDITTDGAIALNDVLGCWYGNRPCVSKVASPGNFLWRIMTAGKSEANGKLKACGVFLSYLTRTWHQQLVRDSPQQLEMFLPERLFNQDELAAYKLHVGRAAGSD